MGLLQKLFGKDKKKDEETPKKKTQPETEKDSRESEADEGNTVKNEGRNYHVSLNNAKDSENYKMWRVRKEKSEKTIKHFKTQKEAIDYAESLAKDSDADVVVHRTDGTIRS